MLRSPLSRFARTCCLALALALLAAVLSLPAASAGPADLGCVSTLSRGICFESQGDDACVVEHSIVSFGSYRTTCVGDGSSGCYLRADGGTCVRPTGDGVCLSGQADCVTVGSDGRICESTTGQCAYLTERGVCTTSPAQWYPSCTGVEPYDLWPGYASCLSCQCVMVLSSPAVCAHLYEANGHTCVGANALWGDPVYAPGCLQHHDHAEGVGPCVYIRYVDAWWDQGGACAAIELTARDTCVHFGRYGERVCL